MAVVFGLVLLPGALAAGQAEPESETTPEAEAEYATTEPNSEPTSEIISTFEPISEIFTSSEPTIGEPTSEIISTFEPISEIYPSAESTFEPIGEITVPENINVVLQPTTYSSAEITIPVILLGFVFMIALVLYALYTRRQFYESGGIRGFFGFSPISNKANVVGCSSSDKSQTGYCKYLPLTKDEEAILNEAENGQNQTMNMLFMSLPSFLALVFCPITLFIHQPMVKLLWPDLKSQPDINEAVGCFLTPAGMVYAINLGFAYQEALGKNHIYTTKITEIATTFREIMRLCLISQGSTVKKRELLSAVKDELFEVIRLFMAPCLSHRFQPDVYKTKAGTRGAILSCLSSNMQQAQMQASGNSHFDTLIARKLLNIHIDIWRSANMMKLIFHKITILQWVFLELLGYLTFIGVVFIQGQSYRCELSMCILTVFSISFLLYFIADLDDPFNGVYRMDHMGLLEIVRELDGVYREGQISLPPIIDIARASASNVLKGIQPASTSVE